MPLTNTRLRRTLFCSMGPPRTTANLGGFSGVRVWSGMFLSRGFVVARDLRGPLPVGDATKLLLSATMQASSGEACQKSGGNRQNEGVLFRSFGLGSGHLPLVSGGDTGFARQKWIGVSRSNEFPWRGLFGGRVEGCSRPPFHPDVGGSGASPDTPLPRVDSKSQPTLTSSTPRTSDGRTQDKSATTSDVSMPECFMPE